MHSSQKRTKGTLLRRILLIVLIAAILAGTLSFVVFAQNSYVITDGENVTVHRSFSSDPDTVLGEAGISLGAEDTYTTAYDGGVNRITICRLQNVTIVYRGMKTSATSYGEPVSELLERMGILLSDGDTLSCDRGALTRDGMQIEIIHRGTEIESFDEVIPYETVYYEDPTLAPDEEVVMVEGQDGLIHRETQISYENGTEVSRKTLSETTTAAMVKKIVRCGVNRIIMEQPEEKETLRSSGSSASSSGSSSSTSSGSGSSSSGSSSSGSSGSGSSGSSSSGSGSSGSAPSNDSAGSGGVLTTAGGETYYYSKVLTCTATAYSCEGYTGHTYSGTIARVGAIAVDPNVIPLGTELYIVTNDGSYVYGYCVAEDIGGGITGNKVDLYFDTIAECWQFGVRSCTVYVLS